MSGNPDHADPQRTDTSSPFSLAGKTVLITGASSGIGRETAIQCARADASIILSGRDEIRLKDTLEAIHAVKPVGAEHRIIVADLNDEIQRRALVDDLPDIDGIVHSAGISGLAPVKMLTEEFLARVMQTNYLAPTMLTQRLLFKQRIRKGGSLLFMTSLSAHTGTVGVGPYTASKTALIGMMRCLALEVGKRGIRVNALSPGLVETPLTLEYPDWLEAQNAIYPLGIGRPIDVALACVFYLSDASRKITGSILSLDGGIPFVSAS